MFKSIFDPDFTYRNADRTDVRLTFARIRREQRTARPRGEPGPPATNVVPIAASPGAAPHPENPWPFPEWRP